MSRLSIHAQDFLNAFEILRESNDALIEKKVGGARGTAYGSLPAMGVDIVCLGFSVELHLKELHRIVLGAPPRGHNILQLFYTLPNNVQDEVGSYRSIAVYGWSDKQLEQELQAISNGFEEWRYAHESTSLNYNIYFAKALIQALQFVASIKCQEPNFSDNKRY